MTPDDEKLEALLREALIEPELPDGGFAARVLVRLPEARALPHYRAWTALAWTGITAGACLAMWACVPWSAVLHASSSPALSPAELSAYAWTTFATVVAMASAYVAWYLRGSPLGN